VVDVDAEMEMEEKMVKEIIKLKLMTVQFILKM
jgi:hypothetical protein